MNFKVTIDEFDGPLDLMLHLIKENKLDLFNLDISVLSEQYLLYINHFEKIHLEIASEYLVELATLIEFKSKKLLPKQDEVIEDEYQEDPKDRLIRRLLEYQQFKEVTNSLDELYKTRLLQFSKPITIYDDWVKQDDNISIDGNPYDLVKAMAKCLKRLHLTKPIEKKIAQKEISMEERRLYIVSKLDRLPKTFNFEKLLEDVKEVGVFIVTFLAVLDLVRLHTLYFDIDENETIWLTRGK